MFETPGEAFLYTSLQWLGQGLIVFLIAYCGARFGIRHERRTVSGR